LPELELNWLLQCFCCLLQYSQTLLHLAVGGPTSYWLITLWPSRLNFLIMRICCYYIETADLCSRYSGMYEAAPPSRALKPGTHYRHVTWAHVTFYILFSTPSLFLPVRWLSYADLYNLVTSYHIKRSVGALFQ
jgi:hypothetical protein